MDNIYWVIAATFFGFVTVAFLLLYPVYRFIRREEKQSESWTRESIARRGSSGGDGAPAGGAGARGDAERARRP